MHQLGFAVDFNAYGTPHLKDRRQLDLISAVTGRPAEMNLGPGHARLRRQPQGGQGQDGCQPHADVSDPGVAQLADTGWSSVKPSATNSEAFGKEFFLEMIEHGFNPLATSGNPDSMHFELRWKGPAM